MQVVSEIEGAMQMDGPVGPLEVLVENPRGIDTGVDLVICHPHPLYGGTLSNKVVHTLARAGRDAGCRAVRFNFRGVGASVGKHDDGRGEVDDLLAVVAGLRSEGRRVLLAGFSFGAWVAAAAAARWPLQQRPVGLLLVAPPVHYTGFDEMVGFAGLPVQVFQGDDDDVVDPDAVAEWCRTREPALPLRILPTGHFFHGSLPELKEETQHWLLFTLSPAESAK